MVYTILKLCFFSTIHIKTILGTAYIRSNENHVFNCVNKFISTEPRNKSCRLYVISKFTIDNGMQIHTTKVQQFYDYFVLKLIF